MWYCILRIERLMDHEHIYLVGLWRTQESFQWTGTGAMRIINEDRGNYQKKFSLLLFHAKCIILSKLQKYPSRLLLFTTTLTPYSIKVYNNTIYCQPCQDFIYTLVPRFVPIIKNECVTLVVMAIVSFLPSSTTSD
jgi:hypothetical protein